MAYLVQASHGLGSATGLLDPFADALGDRITGVAGGPTVDRRTASTLVLGNCLLAQFHGEIAGVVPLVGNVGHRLVVGRLAI